MNDVILSVEEAAELLKLSTDSVYALVRAGKIPVMPRLTKRSPFRIPRQALLDSAAVEEDPKMARFKDYERRMRDAAM